MLKSRPEVSEIHCVKDAKVPLMRFKFDGIDHHTTISVNGPFVARILIEHDISVFIAPPLDW